MGLMMATIRENPRAFRKDDYGLENALAKLARNRWPDKTVGHVAHEWGLSESEAAKVVYANASKNTLNRILHHRRGGFGLFVQLIADATGTTLEQYITQQAEEARRDAIESAARERHIAALEAALAGRRSLDRGAADTHRSGRPTDARLGADGDGEAVRRSFAPKRGGGA